MFFVRSGVFEDFGAFSLLFSIYLPPAPLIAGSERALLSAVTAPCEQQGGRGTSCKGLGSSGTPSRSQKVWFSPALGFAVPTALLGEQERSELSASTSIPSSEGHGPETDLLLVCRGAISHGT